MAGEVVEGLEEFDEVRLFVDFLWKKFFGDDGSEKGLE
jgi:hypothetical protein